MTENVNQQNRGSFERLFKEPPFKISIKFEEKTANNTHELV